MLTIEVPSSQSCLCVVPGCPCLAEYGDQKYYRAELISVIGTEPIQLLVHHVDFGSDDTLPPTKCVLATTTRDEFSLPSSHTMLIL